MTDRTATTYVILGMLGWRPMSGYEIKAIVDRSTRLFWAASYGQIYPELRRLSEQGLVTGRAAPTGGRSRNVYELTDAGHQELVAWLHAEPEVYELRDEGLLKLFFAAATDGRSAPETLRSMRERSLERNAKLRSLQAGGVGSGYAGLVLDYGIAFSRWQADWCERVELELTAPKPRAKASP